ncbi:MAG: radical SAM protein [Myxococcales bacterium]|nr:radical SAM protein [Myxococcales bacterium]
MDSTSIPSSSPERRLLMIYVHVPFCTSKCHFCDWVQPIPKSELLLKPADEPRRRYIDALVTEIRTRGPELMAAGAIPYVVYWGGGTASSLDPSEAERIMGAISEAFDLGQVVESTIECSPETVSLDKLRRFRALGFNRFSSGVQSLDPQRLRKLGRSHDADQARTVTRWAQEAGFGRINIDLMCGFPDETLEEVEQMMAAALELPVTNLSIYAFRPTPGTIVRKRMDGQAETEYLIRELQSFARARTLARGAGLPEYAVGYFGPPALNVVMPFQLRLETIGFGSGAVSFLDGKYHGHNKGHFTQYIEDPLRWDYTSQANSAPVAFSLMRSGLSVYDGLLRREWRHQTGVELDEILADPMLAPVMQYLRSSGKLIEDERGIRLPRSTAANVIVELAFRGSMGQTQARQPHRRVQLELA